MQAYMQLIEIEFMECLDITNAKTERVVIQSPVVRRKWHSEDTNVL